MFKINTAKSFIISRLFGLLLIIIAFILIFSLFTYSEDTTPLGSADTSTKYESLINFYTSYMSGLMMLIFNYSSFLIPIFFLITGTKSMFGIKYNNFVFQAALMVLGLCLLNLFLTFTNINQSLMGEFLVNVIRSFEWFKNVYFKISFLALTSILSIFFIIYGLTFRINFVFVIIKKLISFFIYVFKPLGLIRLRLPKMPDKKDFKAKGNIRSKKEPTINKGSYLNNLGTTIPQKKEGAFEFKNEYVLPPLSLLKTSVTKKINIKELEKKNYENSIKLEKILKEYGVEGTINQFKTGPVITLYEFNPAPGIKTSKVVGLAEDLARAMSSMSTRISFQPGKNTIGIEIPNQIKQSVILGDLLKDEDFTNQRSNLTLALGKSISDEKKFTDLEKMPHLLIAGTTGSGKSVGINCMILSLLFKFKPSECKFILVDPKMLELNVYENIPHLLSPVVTDPKKAVHALKWVVREMENRYRLMSSTNVKNIQSFNAKIQSTLLKGSKLYKEVQTGVDDQTHQPIIEKKEIPLEKMPLIVVVIDEMADLMMVAGKEVENLVQRLAQMARASGIHIIAATQRPSVDVITGTIKANFPSRISYRVASKFDSRTIINEMGAEQLLGSGDMLFLENGANLVRLHGGYVSEEEIEKVVNFIKSQSSNEKQQDITSEIYNNNENEFSFDINSKNVDELYSQAVNIVLEQQKVSTSFIQRYLQIGYNRAARIVEKMEEDGIISEPSHSGKRNVLKKKI